MATSRAGYDRNHEVIDLIDSDEEDEEPRQQFAASTNNRSTTLPARLVESTTTTTTTVAPRNDYSIVVLDDSDEEETSPLRHLKTSSQTRTSPGERSTADDDDRGTLPLPSQEWEEYQDEAYFSTDEQRSVVCIDASPVALFQAKANSKLSPHTTRTTFESANDILDYDWRGKAKAAMRSKLATVSMTATISPTLQEISPFVSKREDISRQPQTLERSASIASTTQVIECSASFATTTPAVMQPEDTKASKRTKKPSTAAAAKKKKSEEEKLVIAAAMGKHRHLELKVMSSVAFWSSHVGGALEFYLVENDRAQNIIKKRDILIPNLLVFQRHRLMVLEDGTIAPSSDHYFMERLAIFVWTGVEIVNDLKSASGRASRIELVEEAKSYMQSLQGQCPEVSEVVNFFVVLVNCDAAIAASSSSSSSSSHRPVHLRDLEDFLVLDLGIQFGISHCHVKTTAEAAEVIYSHIISLEKYPYRKAERATSLDNVKRHKSFSALASQEDDKEKRTNRMIDGSQLTGIWTNQMRCFPRMGDAAENVTVKFPSFRSLYEGLQENPGEVETELQTLRSGRRELKLSRSICTFFLSEDPSERLQ